MESTRDRHGRPYARRGGQSNGVLAGALLLQQSTTDQRCDRPGMREVVVIDRRGQQITTPKFAGRKTCRCCAGCNEAARECSGHTRPRRRVRARRRVRDLQGSGWTTVIDRPRSVVFAPARRGLVLELILIGAAGLIVCGLIGWATRRSRRDAEVEQAQVRGWAELAQSLGPRPSPRRSRTRSARLSPRPFRRPPSSSRSSPTARQASRSRQ